MEYCDIGNDPIQLVNLVNNENQTDFKQTIYKKYPDLNASNEIELSIEYNQLS